MSRANNLNATVSTERTFPASRCKVFAAFEHYEFKPGGKWVFVMHGPHGATTTLGTFAPHSAD